VRRRIGSRGGRAGGSGPERSNNGAGKKLDSGANLIRNFDEDDLIASVRRAIKRNPMASLALGLRLV